MRHATLAPDQASQQRKPSRQGRRPTLLQVIPSAMRGGCENYALTVAKAACQQDWGVSAAFSPLATLQDLASDFVASGAKYAPAKLAMSDDQFAHRKVVVAQQYLSTLKLLAKVRPAVVQLVLPWPIYGLGVMLACATCNIPTQVVFQLVMPGDPVVGKVARAYHWARRRRQRWVAVSEYNRQLLVERFGVPRDEIELIYNGSDAAKTIAQPHCGVSELRQQVRRELGMPEDALIVMSVGRLAGQKGFERLAPAAQIVCQQFPRARFIVAGDGPKKSALLSLTAACKVQQGLLWLGHRSDVPRLLAAADVFAFPTRGEGHPFALVEAMSAGLPAVASLNPGLTEIIDHGVNGLLVDTADADRFAAAIGSLLGDAELSRTMGQRAQLVSSRFSQQRMLLHTLASLRSLATL